MTDDARIQEKLGELRRLVRSGKERLATHSPVWAVYLAGETLRAMGQVLDEMDEETPPSTRDFGRPARKVG
ncbi:MAG: hypothetical protein HY049_03200 [Acidobacteria bacterium]|nr:hypothetical protein [Acidobacteriota bacterium]